jgi:hypothetical protein
MIQVGGAAALSPAALHAAPVTWPPAQGPNTPKICLGVSSNLDEKGMRALKQVGVDYVLMGGPGTTPTSAPMERRTLLLERPHFCPSRGSMLEVRAFSGEDFCVDARA